MVKAAGEQAKEKKKPRADVSTDGIIKRRKRVKNIPDLKGAVALLRYPELQRPAAVSPPSPSASWFRVLPCCLVGPQGGCRLFFRNLVFRK